MGGQHLTVPAWDAEVDTGVRSNLWMCQPVVSAWQAMGAKCQRPTFWPYDSAGSQISAALGFAAGCKSSSGAGWLPFIQLRGIAFLFPRTDDCGDSHLIASTKLP
eukprot:1161700-Pelagomonas_calceolata.AAC.10